MGFVKNILYSVSNSRMINLVKKQSIFPYYHLVSNTKVKHIKHLYEFKSVERFEQDLDQLLKYYKPLDPKKLIHSIAGGELPKNNFLLSFDDGLSEVYDVIVPILMKKKVSAIFFINPNFIDNKDSLYKHDISVILEAIKTVSYEKNIIKQVANILGIDTNVSLEQLCKTIKQTKHSNREKIKVISKLLNIDTLNYVKTYKPYLSKSNIKELIDLGFYFGGHTMSHPRLLELPLEEQRIEIINSIKWLKSNFDIDYSFFAFPFSDKGVAKNTIQSIFKYDSETIVFGNSGIKNDINKRIIHRFSLDNPFKDTKKRIITENLYKFYNMIIGKYKTRRN